MINFHKKVGVPENVRSGEDHLWFTNFGTIYVADNEGHPIPMGAGQMVGKTIPVGKPSAPNILYFCQDNGKHYLSSDKEWLEVPIKTLPGSGSAPGTAGSVIITDPGDYYSSNDVEGALYELGSRFESELGLYELKGLSTDVLKYSKGGNRALYSNTPNNPSKTSGWLNQRIDETGQIYGLLVDKDGNAFTRYGNGFEKLASARDMEKILEEAGGAISTLENAKINTGLGLKGGGSLASNPTIEIDLPYLTSLLELDYLPLTGGTITGNLEISKRIPELVFSDTREYSQVGISVTTGRFKMRDIARGVNFLSYDSDTGRLSLNSGQKSRGIEAQGVFSVLPSSDWNSENPSAYPFNVENAGKENIARFVGNDGTIALRSFSGYNAIQSTQTHTLGEKDLRISGLHGRTMDKFLVNAYESRFSNSVIAGHGMYLAMGHDGYGTGGSNSKLFMFPFHYNPGMSASEARKYFAQMGYNQSDHSVMFQAFKKSVGQHASQWREQALTLTASKFVPRSSIEYKDVIDEYTDSALGIVKDLKPYLYKFKDDDKGRTNLGFIIEKGVPEIAVENGGKSIDTYAMLTILWKAVQELIEERA